MIGPNTAGIVTAGECFVGFMPAFNPRVFRPGNIGVISRSGSLGTLLCLNLVQAGLGISAFVGIGGDPIIGTTTKDALMALDRDSQTKSIALVGEIGGSMEEEAAEYARTMTKPIAAFIAGAASPPGKRMGHAGAIVMGDKGSYAGKKRARSRRRHGLLDAQRRRRGAARTACAAGLNGHSLRSTLAGAKLNSGQ